MNSFTHAPSKLQKLLKFSTHGSELRQIHAVMIKSGLDGSRFHTSKLLAACSVLDFPYARSVFQSIGAPNLFMHNTILRGHSVCEEPDIREVVRLFDSVRGGCGGFSLDQFSFVASIKCCGGRMDLGVGEQIHGVAVKAGFFHVLNVRNVLVSFYCACGMVEQGRRVFDEEPRRRDAVSWGGLIRGYVELRRYDVVVELVLGMQNEGLRMNRSVVVSVLVACGNLLDRSLGGSVHGCCVKAGFSLDPKVRSSLVVMYGKFGCVVEAQTVFREVRQKKDVVLWNCLVDAYARCGLMEQSLELLRKMEAEGLKPNAATLVGMLSACALSGSVVLGRRVCDYVDEEMERSDVVIGTALVDLYSKCGSVDKATEIFNRMQNKDVKAWTAMITGLAINGQQEGALRLFYQMEDEGVRPNNVTFLAVLSACCHGGFVVAGEKCFRRMIEKYNCSPRMEHYGCMVDLLARSGMLKEAYELITSLPIEKDPMAWRAFLFACKVHGNVEFAELARNTLIGLGCEHPTDPLLLSGTYVAAGKRTDVAVLSERLKKEVGWSSVESGEIYENNHPLLNAHSLQINLLNVS